jgi:hypothetical protein
MGKRGREGQYLSKTTVGRKMKWAEFTGLCVGDEIMADLIMDPHYNILAVSLSDLVIVFL